MNQLPASAPASTSCSPTLAPGGTPHAGPAPRRFALIRAQWHADIVQRACDSFLAEIEHIAIRPHSVDVFEVAGAFEIPLHALALARSGRYAAIVACAFVVDGGIYRHEFVADAVISGLMRVQLDTRVPVISAVLTPKNFHEHDEHRRFFSEHFVVKGREAARACLQTVQSLDRLAASTCIEEHP
ncbi:MAG: 6,7-dimethyl-8-ribityllumazine synthase [Burkholderiaceae bacterium]